MIELTQKIELTELELTDLFVTALEGGSNYWYLLTKESIDAIREKVSKKECEFLTEAFTKAVLKGAEIPIFDAENETEKLGVVSEKSIQEGLQKAIDDERHEIDLLREEAYDAFDADVLFQYIVMKEIVFG